MPSEEHSIKPLSSITQTTPEESNATNGNENSNTSKRGKWKKVRVSPVGGNEESFESAESQNLGPQLYNSLQRDAIKLQASSTPDTMKTTMVTPITMSAKLLNDNIPKIQSTTTESTDNVALAESEIEEAKVVEMTTMNTLDKELTRKDGEIGESIRQLSEEEQDHNDGREEMMETTTFKESATRRMDEMDLEEDDLDSQPSLFSEVKKQLHELFSIEDTDDSGVSAALTAVGKRRQEYTNIVRHKADSSNSKVEATTSTALPAATLSPALDEPMTDAEKKAFHKQLMDHVVYATSQPEVDETSETEICYRGRCIKSEDLPLNHKLN